MFRKKKEKPPFVKKSVEKAVKPAVEKAVKEIAKEIEKPQVSEVCELTRSKKHEYTIPLDYHAYDDFLGKWSKVFMKQAKAMKCVTLGCVCGAEKERKPE